MANPLRDAFDFVITSYSEWFAAVRNPWHAAAKVLAGGTDTEHIKRATNVWFAAAFLSIIVTLPVYFAYGLKIENISFHLFAVLTQYIVLLSFAWAMHLGCRRYGIASRFADTFSLYTIVVAAFGPFLTLLSLPAVHRVLRVTSEIKQQKLAFVQAVEATWAAMTTLDNDTATLMMAVLQPLIGIMGWFILASFVVLLSEHYGVEESTAVRAVGFSLGVISPVMIVVVIILQQAVLFAFVQAPSA